MQKSNSIVLLAIAVLFVAGSAEARTAKKSHTTTTTTSTESTERLETHMSAPEHHGSAATIALGVSSLALTGAGGALTGIINFTNVDAVQILAGVGGTTGGFTFGVGGLYKRTIFGGESSGLHVGGGLGIGTVAGSFAMTLDALAGIHYTLPGSAVSFHFDGGGVLSIASSSVPAAAAALGATSSTQTNFTLAPLSGLLGASVVYAL